MLANLQAKEVGLEEVLPTPDDQQIVAMWVEDKWKTRQCLLNSPRNEVEKLIKSVDQTICGSSCVN